MVETRKGTTGDIEELIRLRMAYLDADYGKITEGEQERILAQLPNYFSGHLNQDLFTYVACDGAHMVATVFLYISDKPANPHNLMGKLGEVLNVYTEPNYRKRGISEQLLREMLADAKAWNLSAVKLEATEIGKPLYEKVGFRVEDSRYTAMRYKI